MERKISWESLKKQIWDQKERNSTTNLMLLPPKSSGCWWIIITANIVAAEKGSALDCQKDIGELNIATEKWVGEKLFVKKI